MARLSTWLTVAIVTLSLGRSILAAGDPQPTDRIVTITQWSRGTWMTWVVTPTEIITFKVAGQPIARFPIAADVAKSIADSVATLSPDLGGKEYYGGVDGTMLRVSFSNDGALLPNGIECSNVWMPWLGPMIHKICRAIPTKFEMTYERKMAEQWKQWQSDLQFMGKPAPAQMEVMVKPLTAVYPPEAR